MSKFERVLSFTFFVVFLDSSFVCVVLLVVWLSSSNGHKGGLGRASLFGIFGN